MAIYNVPTQAKNRPYNRPIFILYTTDHITNQYLYIILEVFINNNL